MAVIDLGDFAQRKQAVASGLIWSAPQGAIIAALEDIAAGRIPPPPTIPSQFMALAGEYGVQPAKMGGLMEGQGPA